MIASVTDNGQDNFDTLAERLDEIQQRLSASPGAQARSRWDSLGRSVGVFQRNANDLIQTLAAAEHDERLAMELIQNVRPTEVRRQYFGLLDQRLHNMLASAVSLVDHTRRLCLKYQGTPFRNGFTDRNDIVRKAGGSAFLRDLRNYLLHYGLLAFVHQVSITARTSPLVSQVRLNCAELQTWDGWSAPAKAYMAACGDSIHLSATVTTYVGSMNDLYGWVFEQFEKLHAADVDATNLIVEEFNLTLTGGVSDGRDRHERMAHVQENIRAWREGREQTDYPGPNKDAGDVPAPDA